MSRPSWALDTTAPGPPGAAARVPRGRAARARGTGDGRRPARPRRPRTARGAARGLLLLLAEHIRDADAPRPRASAPPPTTSSIATTSSRGAHYRPLWEHIRKAGPERCSRTRSARRTSTLHTDGVTFTVYGDDGRGHRARLAPRPAAAHHPGRRVGADRGRAQAAGARAEPVPRATSTASSASCATACVPRRADLPRQGLPPRDPRHPAAARHLRPHRGHRPRARRRRPLPGARGQPAHAVRRLVHDREPHRRAPHPARVLRALPGAARRALPGAAAPGAARALAARQATTRWSCC